MSGLVEFSGKYAHHEVVMPNAVDELDSELDGLQRQVAP